MRNKILKPLVFLAALLPLARLVYYFRTDNLGANPIEVITHSTGTWTLIFVMITLSITPLRRLSGLLWMVQYRRMVGLFAFFYAALLELLGKGLFQVLGHPNDALEPAFG